MRAALPLTTLALLTACAAPPSAAANAAEYARQRLSRSFEPFDLQAAMARVRAQEPGAVPRHAARHIDQQEPLRHGARRFHGSVTPVAVSVAAGVGTVEVKAPGTTLNDRAQATFVRLGIDSSVTSPRGAGLHVQIFGSDDDLFSGRMFSDGLAPARADAEVRGVDVFPHLRYDLVAGDSFAMPMRIGLFADLIDVEHAAHVERTWTSVGPRVVFEPAWHLLGDAERGLDLFGRFGGEFGATWLREQFRGGDDLDETTRWAAQVGAGLRANLGRLQVDLGYQLDQIWFGSTSTELYGRRSGTDVLRQGLLLGGTIVF